MTVAVAPDGRTAVTGSTDRTARLWDLDSGRVLATLVHDAPVIAARFTPDGRRLVTFSSASGASRNLIATDHPIPPGEPAVRVWDASNGRRLAEWAEPEVARSTFCDLNSAGAMDMSHDGRRVVVTSGGFPGHPPRIIDLDTGTVRAHLNGHDGPVYSVAFSPDGRCVATAAADRTARLWDAETGRQLHRLAGHTCDVYFATFSPDGRRLLTLGNGNVFTFTVTPNGFRTGDHTDSTTREEVAGRIWDVETGAELVRLTWPKNRSGFASAARFHPDGRTVFTGGESTSTSDPVIWGADRGQFISSPRREAPDDAPGSTALAISPDGQRLAIGYRDGLVQLLSSSGTPLKILRGHTRVVRAMAFTPDGRRLVSASEDGTARVWDARIGAEADFASGRWPGVEQAVYSPDSRIVAAMVYSTTTNGYTLTFRDAASGRELARTERLRTHPSQPPLFSRDGRAILVNTSACDLRPASVLTVFDTASGRRLGTIERKIGQAAVAFSPDGRTVAIADGDGHLVEAETGRERVQLAGSQDHPIHDIRFSPDGTKVVTLSSGPWTSTEGSGIISACLWDACDGRRLAVLKMSGPQGGVQVSGTVFSPDGRRLATASIDSKARIWDVATGRERVVLRGHGGSVNSIAFAPDGRRVVTASDDGTARLWDAVRGSELARLGGHDGPVRTAAFSPDGTVILTYGDDRTARLWGGVDGQPVCTLVRLGEHIRSAGFSPDSRVAWVSWSNLTRTWPVDFMSVARTRCPRELTAAERTRFELPAP
jgi:WD40 repeat protein